MDQYCSVKTAKFTNAAAKLLTGQLAYITAVDKKFKTADGLEFQRIWIQGHVCSVNADGNSFEVTDNTGPPLTVCCRTCPGQRELGEYVLVVGKLGQKRAAKRDNSNRCQEADPSDNSGATSCRKGWQVAAQKVKALGDSDCRTELWHQEVLFLHQRVYHRVVSQTDPQPTI